MFMLHITTEPTDRVGNDYTNDVIEMWFKILPPKVVMALVAEMTYQWDL